MGFLTFLSSPPNNKVDFIYKLAGEPTEINVFELAPTLLALGQLIQDSNRTLYPEGSEIAVNVKPFKEGSFIVDISLFSTVDVHALWGIGQHTSSEQIIGVLTTLGLIDRAAKAGSSVLKVIKALGGKAKKIDEIKPGEFRYSSDNNTLSVSGNIHQLLQNPRITNNIYLTYGKPLEQENVEDIESYLPDDEATKVVVTKEDVPLLKEYATSQPTETADDRDDARVLTNVYLNPKRGSYEGDGKQWSFHRGSGTITATIKDKRFLELVRSGEIRPHYSDLMTVTMSEKQKVTGTRVTVTHEILSVDNYEFGGKQIDLLTTTKDPFSLDSGTDPLALPPAPPKSGGE